MPEVGEERRALGSLPLAFVDPGFDCGLIWPSKLIWVPGVLVFW